MQATRLAVCLVCLFRSNASYAADPTAFEGYLAARFVIAALSRLVTGQVSPATVLDSVYSNAVFLVGGLTFGPFFGSKCSGGSSSDCECSLGLHKVWLSLPMLSSSVPFVYVGNTLWNSSTTTSSEAGAEFGFTGCGVRFLPFIEPASSGPSLLAIILPLSGVFALLTTVFGVWKVMEKRRRRAAALRKAPKGKVVVVFTDVEGSTHLWDVCVGMKEALETHNRVLRELIPKHEVCSTLRLALHSGISFGSEGDSGR